MPRPSKGARLWYDKSAGLWFIRDGNTKRGTGCGHEAREGAERKLSAYLAEKHDPLAERRAEAVKLSDVLAFYLTERAAYQASYTSTLGGMKALMRFWGDKTLMDVRRSVCEAYITHRTAEPLAKATRTKAMERRITRSTAARELAILRAAVKAFHAEVTLDMVPVVYVPPPGEARNRWLTREEAARFIREARRLKDRQAARALVRFILIGLYTGTRSTAIRALKWAENDQGGWIDLERSVIHRRGVGQSQSKKRRPPVRIPRRLRHHLERWYRLDGSKRGFVIHYAGGALKGQRGAWDVAREAAGLGPDVTGHVLRHTAVTWMLQAGVRPWDVAHYTGMSVKVLETTYGHHSPEYQAEAADRVGRRAARRVVGGIDARA